MLTKDDLNQIRIVVHEEVQGETQREGKLIRADLRKEFKNQLSLLKADLRLEIRQAKEILREEMRAMENHLQAAINRMVEFYENIERRVAKLEKTIIHSQVLGL